MAAKIFLTGASGYVGGEVLYQVARLPAKHIIRCLARSEQKGARIRDAFPNVEVVNGDLEDTDLIEREAKAADVVFHLASTRHEASSRAIIKGLSNSGRSKPGVWLQIGGASMLSGAEIKAGRYGETGGKTYDDIADLDEITGIVRSSPSRIIDNLILDQDSSKIKTTLVPGPMIYGKGRGPVNTRTIQGPAIAGYAIKNGEPFQVGNGQNVWSNIHIADLGKLFVMLLEAAIKDTDHVWNGEGIIFPENGQMAFSEVARLVSEAARDQGLIKSDSIKSLTDAETNEVVPHGAVVLGTNAKLSSSRAKKYLGWSASESSLAEEIPRMVKEEAELLKE